MRSSTHDASLPCRDAVPGRCAPSRTCPVERFPAEQPDHLIMRVVRFIGAAYETGDAACWEAAHERADLCLGRGDAELLVARIATIVRLLRATRPDVDILPPPCRRISTDEAALLRLIGAARSRGASAAVALTLVPDPAAAEILADAVRWLVDCPALATAVASSRSTPAKLDIGSKLLNKIVSKEALAAV